MKITFTGQYSEVIKQVNSPITNAQSYPNSFKKLLGDLEPKSLQPVEIAEESRSPVTQVLPAEQDIMARLNLGTYELSPPKDDSRIGENLTIPTVKISASDVKAPNIVSATRIKQSEALDIKSMIQKTGLQEGVDPLLALSVAKAESDFNTKAVSSDGYASKGLFQLLDSTGKQLHSKLDEDSKYDPFNPSLNSKLGVNYLRYLHEIFSKQTELPNDVSTFPAENESDTEKLAVAAFNAGEGRVASAQARAKKLGKDPSQFKDVEPFLPDTTQTYVSRVLQYRDQFENES